MGIRIKKKITHPLWVILMIVFYLSLSYNPSRGWWYSALGTIAIIFFSYLVWSKDCLDRVGLKLTTKEILFSLSAAILFLAGSYILIATVSHQNNIQSQYHGLTIFIHDAFYTLNEEMILGAILLKTIRRKWKNRHPAAISIFVAALFSSLHYIFYRWVFLDKGILLLPSLFTLFAVGILRNNLILTTNHIGFSWALHFSWASILFGFDYFSGEIEKAIPDPQLFNIYLGSTWTLLIASGLAVLSFSLYGRRFMVISKDKN